MAQGHNGDSTIWSGNEPLFDAARPVDREWMELSVTTSEGNQVYFRVPRRTLFRDIDDICSPSS